MKRHPHLLLTPGFLIGLSLLLANDFFFKPLFHNWYTGKLSDFAGLFVFPLFWTALLPGHKKRIYITTAIGFVFWKSPYSQTLIDGLNNLTIWPRFGRTVDLSDLLALVSLAPSYRYHSNFISSTQSQPAQRPMKWATCVAACVAVFAFAATSYRTSFAYDDQEFIFADSKAGLIERFKNLPHEPFYGNSRSSNSAADEYTITIKTEREPSCFGSIEAQVEIREQDAYRSRLILRRLEHRCPEDDDDKSKMLSIFLHEIVEKLQDDIDAHPSSQQTTKPSDGQPRRTDPHLRRRGDAVVK